MKLKQYSLLIIGSWILFTAISPKHAIAEIPPVPKLRLSDQVRPLSYTAELVVVPSQTNFTGQIAIVVHFEQGTDFMWLHSHGLTVTDAHIEQKGRSITAQPVIGSDEFLGFSFQQRVAPGKATLFISYSGLMSDKDFSGLFRREEAGQWYAATQFESVWARRTFPCFDEPGFKVPWRLAVHAKQEDAVVSNTSVVSETDEPGGMKCVRFAQTRPLSSYLIALAVGPFEVVDLGKVGRKKTPVRIFTPKGRKREAAFAAQAIPQLLRRLEDYYDLPYPFEKLDHVPVPQFFGAMENAGLITYEETLLLSPPDRETIGFKRTCANVTTHEMAHQWFGDLVTMSWWDDVWLNESFATWISPKIVDDWQPDWRTALDQLSSTFSAMRADSLVNARCIRQPIEAPSDIDDAFDEITYGKGAAVLGMFEASMGQEPFRKAIRTYFQHHAYQNATASDFLHSLDHTAKQDVGSAFLTFLNQPGVPVLSVRLGAASNGCSTVMLTQRRFLPVGSSGDANRTWKIPLRIDYETKGNELQLATMMGKARESLVIKSEPSDLDWLFLNHGGAGYFDSAYPSELFSNLLQTGSKKFSAAERMTLAHSISETVRSGDLPFGEALALQPQLLADPERRVVEMAAGFMRVRQRIPPEVQANYKRFVLKTVGGLIKGVSWKTDRPETDDQRLQRLALLSLASNAGEETRLISDAKELALAWLKDRQAVPPDEAETIIGVAGRFADASLFASFKAEVKKATDPADRRRLISALGLTKDPQLAKEALDALVAKEFQSVDSLSLLFYLSSHLETSSLVFDYLKQHYDAVVAALPGDVLFSYLPMLAEGFDTSERQKEVESFFSDKDVRLTGGPRIIAQVVEMIHLNQAFNEAQIPSLVQFLKSQ